MGDPGLAGVDRPPAVRRPRLPDEPVRRDLPRRGGRHDRRPGPDAHEVHGARRPRRDRSRAGARGLGDRHARRDAWPAPGPGGRPALSPRRLGGSGPRSGSGATGPGGSLAHRGRVRLRAVDGQPFAHPAPGATGGAVRVRRRTPHPPTPRADRPLRRRPHGDGRRPVPRAAAARERSPRLRTSRHPRGVPVCRARRAVPGQRRRPVRGTRWQAADPGRAGDRPVRAAHAAHPAGLRRDRRPATALRPADGVLRRHHVVLRGVLRERGYRALLPRAVADGLDVAGPAGCVRRDGPRQRDHPFARPPGRPPDPALSTGGVARGHRVRRAAHRPDPGRGAGPLSRRQREPRPLGGPLGRSRTAVHGARCAHRQLVEPLHAAMVCTARRRSAAGPQDRRRQDHPGRRTRRHLHRDRIEPRGPPRLRHPRRHRPDRGTGSPLRARVHRRQLRAEPDQGRRSARGRPSDRDRGPRSRRGGRPRDRTRGSPLVLLPGPQRGGEPGGPRRRGAGGAADPGRDVRDHRRERWVQGSDPGDRGRADRPPPGRRPGRPPPHELRLRRRPALGLRAPAATS